MRVGDIAAGRAGDKGEILDLTLVAVDHAAYARLARWLTAERAADTLNRVVPGSVVRYELPRLRALKFVAPDALPGGVHASLRAGLHWQKAAIWLLLDLALDEPPQPPAVPTDTSE
jgi:hypothetical protein